MRYNNKIRTFASFMYVVHAIFLLPIFIYVPALALSQVSNISVHWITPVVCAVCIFYTTLGGIKAAVWTDALQFITMFGSLILVVAVGVISNGGFGHIFEKFSAGKRMDISFDASITDRNTFWAVTIGASFATLNHVAVNQSFVQKCLTLPTYGSIKRSLSGLALLAVPADVYRYGAAYPVTLLTVPFVILVGYLIYIPVFYKLQITSTYEYLSLRFDNKVRIFASVLFTIQLTLFLPIVIYVPALALAQATGINTHLLTPIVCGVCIFYTTLGGLKAVVWTDAIQFVVMVGSLFVVLIIGIYSIGGFGVIFERAYEGGRLDISFDLNPLKRDTFWTGLLGTFVMWTNHFNINQSFVQKCLALPSFEAVRIALILTVIGILCIMSPSMFTGFVMFAKYYKCDPKESGVITNHDQLVPMFVMEEAHFLPGLPGLFISGIFSAALSTLSAAMNCLAATVYEDLISPFVPKDTSQQRISLYLKLLVVCIGVVSTASVYIVEQLGSILALTISFGGVTTGPLLGLFTVGMLLPMVNEKGALCGGIASLVTMFWIIMTAQWYTLNKVITQPILPVSADGCNDTISNISNQTFAKIMQFSNETTNSVPTDIPHAIYRISIFWYATMGVMITVVISVSVSFFTKASKPVRKDCINPMMHFLLKNDEDPPKYDTVENALALVNKN